MQINEDIMGEGNVKVPGFQFEPVSETGTITYLDDVREEKISASKR